MTTLCLWPPGGRCCRALWSRNKEQRFSWLSTDQCDR